MNDQPVGLEESPDLLGPVARDLLQHRHQHAQRVVLALQRAVDAVLVTEDSSTMLSEAVCARLPVVGVSPADHDFKDFHFKAEVMTLPKANSGIYFHTKFQPDGWPKAGFEAQVNNTYAKDPKKTGSLYDVEDLTFTRRPGQLTAGAGRDRALAL